MSAVSMRGSASISSSRIFDMNEYLPRYGLYIFNPSTVVASNVKVITCTEHETRSTARLPINHSDNTRLANACPDILG
jgi:hypothetical protein